MMPKSERNRRRDQTARLPGRWRKLRYTRRCESSARPRCDLEFTIPRGDPAHELGGAGRRLARDVDMYPRMMTMTNPLSTLGTSLSRGAAVALGGAIERGPRYGMGLDADRPGTTTAQAAYVAGVSRGAVVFADIAIELATAGVVL